LPAKDGLKDLRDAVMRRVDWSPSATSQGAEDVDAHVNDALQQLALDAPFLFFEDVVRIFTKPDASSIDAEDVLEVPAADEMPSARQNPWVLRQIWASDHDDIVELPNDRSWDGRRIDLQDHDGNWHQNRIRSIWHGEEDPPHRYLSLWYPIPHALWLGDMDGFPYRVYDDAYWLQDDIINIRSMRTLYEGVSSEINIVSQRDAERNGAADSTADTPTGLPVACWRAGHFALPTPNTAPDVAVATNLAAEYWSGPEPAGTFQYCYTICWGKREWDSSNPGGTQVDLTDPQADYRARVEPLTTTTQTEGTERFREPLFESAPSPISDEITVANAIEDENTGVFSSAGGVVIELPNIEYQLSFGGQGVQGTGTDYTRANRGHSGWYLRIYRRRLTEDFEHYGELASVGTPGNQATGLTKLDIHDSFHLLQEVPIFPASAARTVDRGTIVPDYNRRLRNVGGYQGISFYPRPDDEYQVELKVLRRPARLVSDNDTPPIHGEAIEVLLHKAIALTAGQLKDWTLRSTALQDYQTAIETLRKRYGDLRPGGKAISLRPARVRQRIMTTQWWRRSDEQ
jgi:hypothetical protein